MIIDNKKNLDVLINRLLPDKYVGTTFEKVVKNFLKNISKQHQYIDHFTNRFDIEKIETDYSQDELDSYVTQYTNVLKDILNIEYPNLLENGVFANGCNFWQVVLEETNPLNNKKQLLYFTGKNSYTKNNTTFLFDSTNRFFKFTKTEHNYTQWNYLIQNDSFSGTGEKYEVYFEVEDIDSNASLYVYTITKFEDLEKVTPVYYTNQTGKHTFRINLANYTLNNENNLIFKFNGSVKLKYIKTCEFDRINKEDIAVLSSQIIQNKGRLGLYTFLFNLLQNLGGDSNTDLSININENEVIGTDTKPRITISEVYQSSITNIKYGDIKENGNQYTFSGQDFYEAGHAFKEYVTTYNSDKVVPFIYKIDATFSQDVFNKYILPIAHPVGWEIIYNIYKLVELSDKLNASNFTEIDNSTYTHRILWSLNSSKQKVYDYDSLQLQEDKLSEISFINNGGDTISTPTELNEYYFKDSSVENFVMPSFFSNDTFLEKIDFSVFGGSDTITMPISEPYFKTYSALPQIIDDYEETYELVYGDDIYYDFGEDLTYSDSGTYRKNNDAINIVVLSNYSYTSSSISANLVKNSTIVKKIQNYGHGIDNACYIFIGTNINGVNLQNVNFESADWYNLDNRQPSV